VKIYREKTVQLERALNDALAREKALSDLLEKKAERSIYPLPYLANYGVPNGLREMPRQVFYIIQKSLHFDRTSVYVLDK
jgi:hypothetical protein